MSYLIKSNFWNSLSPRVLVKHLDSTYEFKSMYVLFTSLLHRYLFFVSYYINTTMEDLPNYVELYMVYVTCINFKKLEVKQSFYNGSNIRLKKVTIEFLMVCCLKTTFKPKIDHIIYYL